MTQHVPPETVEVAKSADLVAVLESYGISMEKRDKDYFGLCPFHSEDSPSFTVYSNKSRFHCFGCGADGDPIDFVREYEGVKFQQAVAVLTGTAKPDGTPQKPVRRAPPPEVENDWSPVLPVPETVPVPPDLINRNVEGNWVRFAASMRWAYKNADGDVLGYVCRFDKPGGKKEVIQQVWARNKNTGVSQWKWLSFPKPRPLYGLDKLADYPDAQVIVVEGEKATDAGQQCFLDVDVPLEKLVVVSWPGGGKAVKHTDWSPLAGRYVGLWPDADLQVYPDKQERAGVVMPFLEQPGTVAMLDIWGAIKGSAAKVRFIMPPEDVEDGWDLADPAPSGFVLLTHLKNSAVDPETLVHAKKPDESNARDLPAGTDAPAIGYERHLADNTCAMKGCSDGSTPCSSADNGCSLQNGSNRRLPFAMPLGADARDGATGTFPLTEMGNCHRLVAAHRHDICFVPELRAWLVWAEDKWLWDTDGARIRSLVATLGKEIYQEGAKQMNDAEHFLKWARKSQEARTIRNVTALLEDVAHLRIPVSTIDGDPFLVGIHCARQVINLRTGERRLARRSDFVTRSLGVSEIGTAEQAVVWKRFLEDIYLNDAELIEWFQRFIGYCLTGCCDEQLFIFAHGGGSNGKSVLIKTIKALAGEYCRTVAAGTLMEQKRGAGDASPDIAELAGARLLLASETSAGSVFDEQFLKGWTGGDAQVARKLYRDQFTFEPTGKLFIAGNYRPRIGGTDHAIWRRVRLLPFMRTFSDEEKDPAMSQKLHAELPHIFAWALEGCLAWQKRPLIDTPKAMKDAGLKYLDEQDILGQFLSEMTRSAPDSKTTSKELYECYRAWMNQCNLKPVSRQAFGRQLGERGFNSRHTNTGAVYDGIALAPNVESNHVNSEGHRSIHSDYLQPPF